MPEPTRRRRKDARPGEIARAAMESFAEQGFAGTRVEDVARRAGVAKGTVYLYYKDKDELFAAAVRECIAPVFDGLEALDRAGERSASELLTAILARVYSQLAAVPERRALLRMLIAEGPRFPSLTRFYHDTILARARLLLARVVQRGLDSGEFRPGPVLEQPQVLIGPVLLAVVWKLIFEEFSPLDLERHLAAHVDLVLHGLRTRPDDPSPG